MAHVHRCCREVHAGRVLVASSVSAPPAAVLAGVVRRDHVLTHAGDAAVGGCADLCGARHLPLPRLHDSRCATCRAARTRWVGTIVPGAKSPPLMRTWGMT